MNDKRVVALKDGFWTQKYELTYKKIIDVYYLWVRCSPEVAAGDTGRVMCHKNDVQCNSACPLFKLAGYDDGSFGVTLFCGCAPISTHIKQLFISLAEPAKSPESGT